MPDKEADRAVDGENGTCAHTRLSKHSWLAVYFDGTYVVESVALTASKWADREYFLFVLSSFEIKK